MLIRTLPPKGEDTSVNPIMVIFVFFVAIIGLLTLLNNIDKNSALAEIKAHVDYYNSMGVSKIFWQEVERKLETKVFSTYKNGLEDTSLRVYQYRIRISSEIEYPRYIILGQKNSKGEFVPCLVLPDYYNKDTWFSK